jgi:probable phosphoglycerate mutase
METARIIAADRSLEVAALAGLREIHLGQWDGLSFRQVRERWPEAFRQRGTRMAGFRPPGGESFVDLQHRVVPVFEKAVEQAGRNILIVAHAGVNRMILCHLLGMPPANLFRLAQDRGAMNLIDRQTDGFRIQATNLPPV